MNGLIGSHKFRAPVRVGRCYWWWRWGRRRRRRDDRILNGVTPAPPPPPGEGKCLPCLLGSANHSICQTSTLLLSKQLLLNIRIDSWRHIRLSGNRRSSSTLYRSWVKGFGLLEQYWNVRNDTNLLSIKISTKSRIMHLQLAWCFSSLVRINIEIVPMEELDV